MDSADSIRILSTLRVEIGCTITQRCALTVCTAVWWDRKTASADTLFHTNTTIVCRPFDSVSYPVSMKNYFHRLLWTVVHIL